MNKHIKAKKKLKIQNKKFDKQFKIFSKQFSNLAVICSCFKIDITDVKKVYKRVNKMLNKDEFQTSLHMILMTVHQEVPISRFKENSQFKYYWNLYKSLGVMFKDNKGNIKLKYVPKNKMKSN